MKKRIKIKGFEPSKNKDYIHAMLELRRSNASSRHTLKKYKGTRSSRKNASIKEFV